MEYFQRIYRSFSNDIRHRKKLCLLYSIPACFALLFYYRGVKAKVLTFLLVPAAFRSLHLIIRPYVEDQNNRVYSFQYMQHLCNACLTTSNTCTLGIWICGVTTALDVRIKSNTMASSAITLVITALTTSCILLTLGDSNSPAPLINLSEVLTSLGFRLVRKSLANKLGINKFFPNLVFEVGINMLYDRFVRQDDSRSIMLKYSIHSIVALLTYSTSSSIERYIEHPLLYATAFTAETAFVSFAEDKLTSYLLPVLHMQTTWPTWHSIATSHTAHEAQTHIISRWEPTPAA